MILSNPNDSDSLLPVTPVPEQSPTDQPPQTGQTAAKEITGTGSIPELVIFDTKVTIKPVSEMPPRAQHVHRMFVMSRGFNNWCN